MATCKKCGKRGLFFKVNKAGYCKECNDKFVADYRARAKEDPSLREWKTQKSGVRINMQTVVDMLQFVDIPYSFENVPMLDDALGGGILLEGSNRLQAQNDISAMNNLLQDAFTFVSKLPKMHIGEIRWVPENWDYGDYARLFCNPYTKTGKISKHPVRLSFETRREFKGNGVSGEISYLASGTIGRVKLVLHKSNRYYVIVFSLNKQEFSLDYAYTIDANNRDVNLYKRV